MLRDPPVSRPCYQTAVHQIGILKTLAAYDPHIAGTPPLGVEVETSDIDILCYAADGEAFVADVLRSYSEMSGFRIWQWVSKDRPVIATFRACGWAFEIFASRLPVAEQFGWRHFEMERRLLALGGDGFKSAIQALRRQGLKTEPAFWSALGQDGDAYLGLLSLEQATETELRAMLDAAGFGSS